MLWYEAPKDVDSTDLFTRLNVGRIPLTDAELVKALLLSRSQDRRGQTDRALEIAAHWDGIERDLRSPEVWAFVTGEANERGDAHQPPAGHPRRRATVAANRPLFHTFETLRSQIEEDPQAFWRDVVDLHSLVLGWYDDRDLFHKVGYLIAVGRTFEELVELSKDKGRSAFEAALDDEIRNHLSLTAGELADLTYTSRKTSDVLLLMNVETIRRDAGLVRAVLVPGPRGRGVVARAHPRPERRSAATRSSSGRRGWSSTGPRSPTCPTSTRTDRADLLGAHRRGAVRPR